MLEQQGFSMTIVTDPGSARSANSALQRSAAADTRYRQCILTRQLRAAGSQQDNNLVIPKHYVSDGASGRT
jgi:hypothetical protein